MSDIREELADLIAWHTGRPQGDRLARNAVDVILARYPWITEEHTVEWGESEIYAATFEIPRTRRYVTPWREA